MATLRCSCRLQGIKFTISIVISKFLGHGTSLWHTRGTVRFHSKLPNNVTCYMYQLSETQYNILQLALVTIFTQLLMYISLITSSLSIPLAIMCASSIFIFSLPYSLKNTIISHYMYLYKHLKPELGMYQSKLKITSSSKTFTCNKFLVRWMLI